MSRNNYSKWQRDSSKNRSPEEYDNDNYGQQDLRYRIEEGRKAKAYSSQLKSNVTAVIPKHEDKYSKYGSSHRSHSHHYQQQQQQQHDSHRSYSSNSSHRHSMSSKSDFHTKEPEPIKKKHEDDYSSSKALSKKIRLEAETSEIISEGSNDEFEMQDDDDDKKNEIFSDHDDKTESEHSKSEVSENNEENSENEEDNVSETEEGEKKSSSNNDSDRREKSDEQNDSTNDEDDERKKSKKQDEDDVDEDHGDDDDKANDRDKSSKSLEDISSDSTLYENKSQNSQVKSDDDTDVDMNKQTDNEDEVVDSDAEHNRSRSHHKHKHSRRKKSKKSSKKRSKKHHKHKNERDSHKDEDEEEEEEDERQENDEDVEEIDDVAEVTEEYVEEIQITENENHVNDNNNNLQTDELNGTHTPPLEQKDLQIIERFNCAIEGCRSVEEFECLNRIEEGTYGVVYRAKDKKTNELVALKRLKMEKEREGFPITSLREIDTLLKAQHTNIVTVREIVVGSNMDKIYLVMDFVEHDLKSLMQYSMSKPFHINEVKTLMIQLLSGIAHLHDNWIIHRDLKTSNLLLSHKGVLKIADFGLAREYGSPLKEYTPVVVTLWYRSVELLLGVKKYSTAVDMWSVGTIFGELLLMKALFQGKDEKNQLDRIFKDLGTPNEKIWPGYKDLPLVKKLTFAEYPYNTLRSRFGSYLSDTGFDLLNKLLIYDPDRRISADKALAHDYFKESPLPKDPSMFPTWPAKSEGSHKKHDNEPKAPEAGITYEKLLHQEDGFSLQPPITAGFQLK